MTKEELERKYARRIQSAWNPDAAPKPKRTKTDHEAAVAYAKKAWGKFSCRDAWEESIRYKGQFTL